MHEADDSDVLERAANLHYTLVTKDHDFLRLASEKLQHKAEFAGIIYIAKDDLPIGQCIKELELAAKVYEPEEILSQVLYLPL
jgi:predicted nuclease of predicted toxin-antitoxin system